MGGTDMISQRQWDEMRFNDISMHKLYSWLHEKNLFEEFQRLECDSLYQMYSEFQRLVVERFFSRQSSVKFAVGDFEIK